MISTLSLRCPRSIAWNKKRRGTYELVSQDQTGADQAISCTCIANLSQIFSNDLHNQLSNMLLYAADGRLRLKNLVAAFADDFDLMLIDTRRAWSITLETALLCSVVSMSFVFNDGRVRTLPQPQPLYTRTAQNETYSQFKRLPNPDLAMYVLPHLTGTELAPIPGYSTVFPFYQRVQYAMPGGRTEAY